MSNFIPGFCQTECVDQDCPLSFNCQVQANVPMTQDSFIMNSIESNLFWLRIMMEHAIFMRLGFACVNVDLITEAQIFERAYADLLNRARQIATVSTEENVRLLNQASLDLTKSFACFKTMVLDRIITCGPAKIGGYNFALLIDHIRREAINFVTHLTALQVSRCEPLALAIIREEVFWLRIMADHAKFILHLLDPSERQFVEKANQFSTLFDQLRFQALDLKSMLEPNFPVYPILKRFTRECLDSAIKIQDFKAKAEHLIAICELLGAIPELLADHVKREAERFTQTMQRRSAELSKIK